MGADKALLRVGGRRLVDRAAAVLGEVCAPVLEVGPGHSGLPAAVEDPPGAGPLAALIAGADALRHLGPLTSVVLLAVDMPGVTADLLRLIASDPSPDAVVPIAQGQLQPLCARYPPTAVEAARALLAGGETSMRALLAAIPVRQLQPEEWAGTAPPDAFQDLDTPADLDRLTQ
jgi:molybdopterin-guanine dinucleotide biosynthesis protein A